MAKSGFLTQVIVGRVGKCDCHPINCPCDDAVSNPLIATQALLHKPISLAVHPNGNVYIADQANYKIKRVETAKVQLSKSTNMYILSSPATDEIYYFDNKGQHLSTSSLLSGQLLYNFSYTADQKLSKILLRGKFKVEVVHLNSTQIVLKRRNGREIHITSAKQDNQLIESVSGETTEIITSLEYGDRQLLVQIASSNDGNSVHFGYHTATSILSNVTDAVGNVFELSSPAFSSGILVAKITKEASIQRILIDDNEFVEKQGKTFTKLTSSPSGFALDSSTGEKTLFEKMSNPLLLPNEEVVLKQKISFPEVVKPARRHLNHRVEWRNHVGRGSTSDGGAYRIVQVNGRNMFTVQFDRTQLTDTLIDNYDNDLLQISWQEQYRQFKYDEQSRLVHISFASTVIPSIIRKIFYHSNSSSIPTTVQIGTEPEGNFTWILNNSGNKIVGLITPSGEKHNFFEISNGGVKMITYQTDDPSERPGVISYAITYNAEDQITRFSTEEGKKYFVVKRDEYGRIESLNYSESNSFQYTYDKDNRISNIIMYSSSGAILNSVYFNYEYDDLLKLVGLNAVTNEFELGRQRFDYYASSGLIHKMANCTFEYSTQKRRISHRMFSVDTHYLADRKPVRLLLLSSAMAQILEASFEYDSLGRLTKTIWTVGGQTQTSEEHLYNPNGQLSKVVLSRGHQWSLAYDQNMRLKQINNVKLKLGAGGLAQKLGDTIYESDHKTGWIDQRGSYKFEYDSIGQLLQVNKSSEKTGELKGDHLHYTYAYDDQNRLVKRTIGENGRESKVHIFYYALPHKPHLITHYTSSTLNDNQAIWTIHYNNDDEPFLLENSSGQLYVVVVDPFKSTRFIVDYTGAIVRELVYSPLGKVVEDTNPDLFFPLGYSGHFQDFETDIVLVREQNVLRPLDCTTGRFMSVSISSFAPSIDLLHPEKLADPWSFKHNTQPWAIPTDVGSWLKLAGVDFGQLVLSGTNSQRQPDVDLFNPLVTASSSFQCPSLSLIRSQLCALQDTQLQLFHQLLTMKPASSNWQTAGRAKHEWNYLQDYQWHAPIGPVFV
uniref:Uncharacterized protein n=1 Tax=Ditylenchus dipsaci TaxID=166011 RepID=A0A915CTH4_9BILA